jgi:hypothetical protein
VSQPVSFYPSEAQETEAQDAAPPTEFEFVPSIEPTTTSAQESSAAPAETTETPDEPPTIEQPEATSTPEATPEP